VRNPFDILADGAAGKMPIASFSALSCRILTYAQQGLPVLGFLGRSAQLLQNFSGCDAVEIRVVRRGKLLICETMRDASQPFRMETVACQSDQNGIMIPCLDPSSDLERICDEVIHHRCDPFLPFFTANGSFWTGDAQKPIELSSETCKWAGGRTLQLQADYLSLAIIPFTVRDQDNGLMFLKSKQANFFGRTDIEFYEDVARILGIAQAHRRAEVALRERVKELTCLCGLAKLAGRPGISLEEVLQKTVELLPPAWLYPEIASARIVIEDQVYSTPGFDDCKWKQMAEVVVGGTVQGTIEVGYAREKRELDEGPFLIEERNLIDTVAHEVALIIERMQAAEDKETLQEQLRHADRLATIGQLAAGVAHELNEPLSSILGFAQLIEKAPDVPDQAKSDNAKIIAASLHAREVIKKLRLFARDTPPAKNRVNLNNIVHEGLYILEARAAKAGIILVKDLQANLPDITADPGQLYQVLVNLVVNAIQSMPDGGSVTIRTRRCDGEVALRIEDTGIGMDEEVRKKAFMPFFTTKDVNEGTGLGLAVVHGIVTSHGGTISVESDIGEGTCFEVRLPSIISD